MASGAQPDCSPDCVTLLVLGVLLAATLARGLHVNLSASPPWGLYGWSLICRRAGWRPV